jgi:hypothetical protein
MSVVIMCDQCGGEVEGAGPSGRVATVTLGDVWVRFNAPRVCGEKADLCEGCFRKLLTEGEIVFGSGRARNGDDE